MTRKTQEKIAVMQASLDGKVIQVRDHRAPEWCEAYKPLWNWADFEYRVAPEVIKIYVYKHKSLGEIFSRTKPFESSQFAKDWTLLKTIETEI